MRGAYFEIHTYTHTGDIPTASILERNFPVSGAVDISRFVYKSFAVMLSTCSNWTVESGQAVFTQHACPYTAEPEHNPKCHGSEGLGRVRKGRATNC